MCAELRISNRRKEKRQMLTAAEYNTITKLYADNLYRYALKVNGDAVVAQDIIQNVFLKLWQIRERVNVESVKALLYKMTYQQGIDQYRSEKARVEREGIAMQKSHDTANQYGSKDLLEIAFKSLKAEAKNLILLRDYEGYSYAEISDLTGLPLSTVKVNLYRARKKMQEQLLTLENEVK